jgi:ABC-type oligopeptide transport system substrate-binding subunit
MRAFKIMTGSALVAAALAVSACGGSNTNTTDNTTITDMNASEGMDSTMNDSMTSVDGATNGGMMANDTMGTMGGNDMMMSNSTDTMTTNAM